MNRLIAKIILSSIFFALAFVLVFALAINSARAESFSVKLPYAKGQSFVLVQGYNSLPTHIKKDAYALDFSQNGCQAYGKSVVAVAAGKVLFMSQEGYNGGYGTEVIIDHGKNIVSRYAHMIPNSIEVGPNSTVKQGQVVGSIGDTGLVAGLACSVHPGTHLHFAMDTVNGDGTFSAYDPEPISGYIHMTAGRWYLSDNAENNDEALASVGSVLGAFDAAFATTTTPAMAAKTTTATTTIAATTTMVSTSTIVIATTTAPASIPTVHAGVAVAVAAGSSGQSSPSSSPSDDGANSTTEVTDVTSTPIVATSSAAIATSGILFSQSDDSVNSLGSWYGDNWFDLGNGFGGTLNSLTLEGGVNGNDLQPLASHIALQEFKDADYSAMIQQFTISDNAPFTAVMATATFDGLSIPLKPYFYYRLTTGQDRQNMSVVLAGTPSTTTGVAMHDNFVYGTGRVESTSTFFPYITMDGIEPTSTLTPPPLTTPTDLAVSFDELDMQINLSFSVSTDPEWPANPVGNEVNYSTSTSLDDAGWQGNNPIPVAIGNSYLLGVRGRDNYGAISAIATTTWNFPAGFVPYLLSPGLGYADQSFTVDATTTLQSIGLYTTNFQTGARNPSGVVCSLEFSFSNAPNSWETIPSDNGYAGPSCGRDPVFSFASSSILLAPGVQYQWIFQVSTGNPSTGASVQFYGSPTNTAGGLFNDPSLANAKFVVNGTDGVLFAN